ncbi:MAG: hypothetical protein ABI887_11945 [Burkholderiales bacterium]
MRFIEKHGIEQRGIERQRRLALCAGLASVAGLSLLASCSTTSSGNAPAAPSPAPSVRPTAAPVAAGGVALPPPGAVRNWNEVRLQAAKRLVAANPQTTYTGEVPEPLLAIPVLEIELHADGSIRRVEVMRKPSQALDTIKLATDAVYRAAPFGDVSRLPKPWRFTETFLFDDDRKFKPRTLDQ